MTPVERAWLLAQLGSGTDVADLESRYRRLGSVKAVALEVLAERRAALLADPLRVTVDGVVTTDHSENLRGIERVIGLIAQGTAPGEDEETPCDEQILRTTRLSPIHRFR